MGFKLKVRGVFAMSNRLKVNGLPWRSILEMTHYSQNQWVIKPQDLIGSTVRGKDVLNKEHIIPLTDKTKIQME